MALKMFPRIAMPTGLHYCISAFQLVSINWAQVLGIDIPLHRFAQISMQGCIMHAVAYDKQLCDVIELHNVSINQCKTFVIKVMQSGFNHYHIAAI